MGKDILTIELKDSFLNQKEINEIAYMLVCESDKDVGKTHQWVSSLLEAHFENVDKLLLLVKNNMDNPIAIIPFYIQVEKVKGLKLKIFRPISSFYSTHGGLLVSKQLENVLVRIFRFLNKYSKWDAFECCVESNSDLEASLYNVAEKFSYKVISKKYESAPFLSLNENLETFIASRSRNFRSNLKRKEKKLKSAGDLTLNIYSKLYEVEKALEEIFRIEKRSWKVMEGSAMTSDKNKKKLYSILAMKCAENGWLRIYILSIDGKPIAFDYGLLFKKRYSMLKTSYDENFKKLSPGVVLRWYVIKDLFKIKSIEHDFLWGSEPYKLQWCNGVRKHNIIFVYNRHVKSRFIYSIQKITKMLKELKING